jgi:hypothetical protein
MRTTLWLLGMVLLAAGCASHGNEVLRDQNASIVDQYVVDGKTTRSEIERLYGPPNSISFANPQNDIWIYRWARSTAKAENFIPYVGAFVGGADVQQKELVILFNDQNVVVRHTMRETNEAVRRNLSSSASGTANAPQVQTSPAPAQSAASPAAPAASPVTGAPATAAAAPPARRPPARVAAGPSAPAPTASSIEIGRWACGMRTSSDRRYAVNFTVAADRSITVGTYDNVPAAVIKTSPLTFTAVNPRGARVVTFTLQADNSVVLTGPSLNNANATFYDEGNCVKGTAGAS